jgi:hypothetical protein
VVFLKFRFGLAVRYCLPRPCRIEGPSSSLVLNLFRGRSLRLDHLVLLSVPARPGAGWLRNEMRPGLLPNSHLDCRFIFRANQWLIAVEMPVES